MRSILDAVHLIQRLYYTFSLLDRRSRIRSAAASVSCIGAFLSLGAALAAAASSFRLDCTIHGLETYGAFLIAKLCSNGPTRSASLRGQDLLGTVRAMRSRLEHTHT